MITISGVDAFNVSGDQKVILQDVETVPGLGTIALNTTTSLGGGLGLFTDASGGLLASALGGANFGLFDPSSLADGANGNFVELPTPPRDLFGLVSRTSPNGGLQLAGGSFLRRLFETGDNALNIADIGTTLTTRAQIEAALDALGDVSVTDLTPGDLTDEQFQYDVDFSKTLRGVIDLAIAGDAVLDALNIGDVVNLSGTVEVTFLVEAHLSFGADADGFFVLPTAEHEFVIRDIQIAGNGVRAGGKFGFLTVELRDAELTIDPSVQLQFNLGVPGTMIRVSDLAAAPGSLISFALASGGTNDVVFGATLAVGAIIPGLGNLGLADTHVSFTFDNIATDTFDLDIGAAAGMSGAAFAQFLKLDPQALFDKLSDLRDQLAAISGEVDLDIPFLNTTIDQVLNIADVIDTRILGPLGFDFAGVAGRVANFRTAQDLAQVLSAALTDVGENVTNQVLVNLQDLGFQFQNGELTYLLQATKFFSLTGQAIDFGLNLPDGLAGLEVDGVINLNVELTAQITLGIDLATLQFNDLDSLLDALFIRDASIAVAADFLLPDLDATARIGFIEVEVQNGRVVADNLSLNIGLEDPDNADGKNQITLRELIDTITSSPLDLIGDPVLGGTVDIVLPLAVPSLPSLGIATASAATTLTVHADLSTTPITFEVELPPVIDTIQKILDFDNMSAADMIGMLQQVVDLLIAMTNGKALQTPIPFTGKTLGDVLEFGKSFKAEFLDPLFVSGDALKPDADGDGDYDLNFNTIQGLVQTLADRLGIPVTVVYDESRNDFTFNLAFERSLGFGEATVTETRRGGGGLNEQQTVRIDAVTDSVLGDTFRLGFPDAAGKTDVHRRDPGRLVGGLRRVEAGGAVRHRGRERAGRAGRQRLHDHVPGQPGEHGRAAVGRGRLATDQGVPAGPRAEPRRLRRPLDRRRVPLRDRVEGQPDLRHRPRPGGRHPDRPGGLPAEDRRDRRDRGDRGMPAGTTPRSTRSSP